MWAISTSYVGDFVKNWLKTYAGGISLFYMKAEYRIYVPHIL